MHDPHSILLYTRRLTISRLDNGDYSGPKPWRVVLNPLRYSIHFGERRQWHINRRHRAFFAIDRLTVNERKPRPLGQGERAKGIEL
jgi:hypothetical protein